MTAPSVDLSALDALAEAATISPWEFIDPGPTREFTVHWFDVDADDDGRAVDHGHTICTMHDVGGDSGEADGQFIVALRNAYPALKAEIEALRGALAEIAKDAPAEYDPGVGFTGNVDDEYERGAANTHQWLGRIARAALGATS